VCSGCYKLQLLRIRSRALASIMCSGCLQLCPVTAVLACYVSRSPLHVSTVHRCTHALPTAGHTVTHLISTDFGSCMG
jgi:hypothetical protein